MTLQHIYGANGICDSFAFAFPIDQEADIQVLIDTIEQTAGFTIHGAASPGGGVVVFLAPPAAGKTVLIRHRGRSAVSSADASSGYLSDKLVAGTGISLTPVSDAEGCQTLVVGNTLGMGDALDPDQNLADLTDKAAARVNLGVYSTTQVDAAIAASSDLDLKKAQNLADLADKAVARTNLGVYSTAQVDVAVAASADLDLKKAQNLADLADKAVARTNLGLDNVAYVNVAQNWTAPQRGAVVTVADPGDGGTITLDFSQGNNFEISFAASGTRTLAAPVNRAPGQGGVVTFIQPASGGAVVVFDTVWDTPGGIAPSLTTTASARDELPYYDRTGAAGITCRLQKDLK